jgi:hypothetical protein
MSDTPDKDSDRSIFAASQATNSLNRKKTRLPAVSQFVRKKRSMTKIIGLATAASFLISLANPPAAQELFAKAPRNGQPATSASAPAVNYGQIKPPIRTRARVRSEFILHYQRSFDFLPVTICKNDHAASAGNGQATKSKDVMLNTARLFHCSVRRCPMAILLSLKGNRPVQMMQELAKKLSNPVASLISVPFQSNVDFRMGTGSGWRYTLNFQPVYSIALSPKWNMISRTIMPIIHQSKVVGTSSQSGLGDIVQSLFFSPNKSEPFVWAVGPVVLIPTATNDSLGSKQLGMGATALVLKQDHGWT